VKLDEKGQTAGIAALVGAWGVLNGFAVYILWTAHDPQQTRWSFALGLAGSALAAWVIETLRERLRPPEHEAHEAHEAHSDDEAHDEDDEPSATSSERTGIARFLLTLISLATFELFIAAIDHSMEVFRDPLARHELRERLLGPALFGTAGTTRDLIALAVMWIVAGAAVSGAVALVVLLPRRKPIAERSRDGLLSGIGAGAIAAPVLVLLYVLTVRVALAFGLALFHPHEWQQHLDLLAPAGPRSDLILSPVLFAYDTAFTVIGPLFTSGWTGKLAAVAIFGALCAIGVRFKRWWPFGAAVAALAVAVVAPLSRDFAELLQLPLYAAVVWIVPGAILGAMAPLLENPSQRASLWASVSVGIGAIVMIVTFVAHQNTGFLVVGAAIAAAGTILLRRDDLEVVWPYLAIAVSLATSSATALALHASASFHSVLTDVAHINALPANLGEDPNHLIARLKTSRTSVAITLDAMRKPTLDWRHPFPDDRPDTIADLENPEWRAANALYGLRQRAPAERYALLDEAARAVRTDRDRAIEREREYERSLVAREPRAVQATIASKTLLGFTTPLERVSNAQLAERLRRDDVAFLRPAAPADTFGPAGIRWHAIGRAEEAMAETTADVTATDAAIAAERAVADADERHAEIVAREMTAYAKSDDPEKLEVAMAGSVAFWMTVALLGAWQSRRNAEAAAE